MKKKLLPLLILAASLLPGCYDHPGDSAKAGAPAPEPARVETTAPVRHTTAVREFSGSVASLRQLPIASRLPAYIRSVQKNEGDIVRKGDVLVTLDDADVRSAAEQAGADVRAAEIRLRDAQTDVEKFEGLYREEAASEIELRKVRLVRDQTAESLRASRARLRQARERLGDAVIRAPEDARVMTVLMQPGTLAVPGLPIIRLESLGEQVFEVHVPAEFLGSVRPGTAATVRLDGRDSPIEGRVLRSVQSADPVTRTGLVKISLPQNERLLSGTFGRAQFEGGASEEGLYVPKDALAERGGLTGAFVVTGGKAEFHWLRLGKTLPDGSREVLAGLSGGETLVKAPPATLFDGNPVKAAECVPPAAPEEKKP